LTSRISVPGVGMQRADHARAVKVEDGIDTFVFNKGMIRLRTVRYTLRHTS
jgi:hypothetical protein